MVSHYATDVKHQVALEHCLLSIREKYGSNVKIYIVDDHSPLQPTSLQVIASDPCIQIHKNPHPQSGEFGAMYWYWTSKTFAPEPYAFIIHDSMMCRETLPVIQLIGDESKPEQAAWMLWHFDSAFGYHLTEVFELFSKMSKSEEELRNYYVIYSKYNRDWVGCFGMASFVARQNLQTLQDTFSLFTPISHVCTRSYRQAMERVYGLTFCQMFGKKTLCGSIFKHPAVDSPEWATISYEKKKSFRQDQYCAPFLKTWFGR